MANPQPETAAMLGPWEVVWLQGDKLRSPSEVCVAGTDNRVAFLASNGNLQTARLIAAAPELLNACKLAVAAMGNMDAAKRIQDVIDMAEGQCHERSPE